MSDSSDSTDSEPEPQASIDAPAWEQVGRAAVAAELGRARHDVNTAIRDVEDTIRAGQELDAEEVRAVRHALNRARRVLEDRVALVAGDPDGDDDVEPWGEPVPDVPYGVYREVLEA